MTQDPQNPQTPRGERPSSAWAPRPSDPPEQPNQAPGDAGESQALEETPGAEQPSETTAGAEQSSSVTPEETAVPPAEAAAGRGDTQPPASPPRRSGVPVWLVAVAAIFPALIVGVAVYLVAAAGSDDEGSSAAGIVDGLMRLGRADQASIASYAGELPPEFAPDLPMYADADVVVSIAVGSPAGTAYFIVLSTPDPADEVFAYYIDALDDDPWQVEVGRASDEFTGLRFLRPDNIDVSGDVSLFYSELDERTTIYLSYNDISQALGPGRDRTPFSLGTTRPLPAGFPEEVPIYEGEESSVVLDTYFERGQGGRAFIVTFLTRDSQSAVIDFYREEFEALGWTVSESNVPTTSFSIAIEFTNNEERAVAGSVTADAFDDDPTFTQVDLLVTTR